LPAFLYKKTPVLKQLLFLQGREKINEHNYIDG